MPDVDLFVRSSGEQRTSNFLLWQSAYAEMVFLDTLWPDFDRRHLWHAIELYASRDRRYGGALPNEAQDAQVPKISKRVTDVDEAVLGGDPVGPPLDGWPSTSTVTATVAADKMMMMSGAAASVDGFAIDPTQHVDLT